MVRFPSLAVCAVLGFSLLALTDGRRFVQIPANDFSLQEAPLTITAFNVQVLGLKKFAKPEVVNIVKDVILNSDITLIQEIRDSSETVPYKLLALVGKTHAMVVSKRLGRSNSKEQYAYYYRKDKVELLDTYQYPDTHDWYERPPYMARFKALTSATLDNFGILGIHTSPSDAVNETSHLVDVYDAVQAHYGALDNVLIAGDLNADCNYVDGNDWSEVKLRNDPRFKWLTSDTLDTTVSATDCTYDRFVAAGTALQEAYIPQSSGIVRFDIAYKLDIEEAKDVSDHYPIILQLDGTAHKNLQSQLSTATKYTVSNKQPAALDEIRAIYRNAIETSNGELLAFGYEVEVLQKKTGGMLYVTATRRNVRHTEIIPALEEFRARSKAIANATFDAVRAYVWSDEMKAHFVYGLDVKDTGLFDIEIHCRLKTPLICRVTLALQTSD